jgi:UDP-N-acetylmuramate--alanine ligase
MSAEARARAAPAHSGKRASCGRADRPWRGRALHFVGVGGAGMSGYARVAHELGARVSGSDRGSSPYLERLRAEGVLDARIGHHAANVPAGQQVEVVYSSAVPAENPERAEARARGLRERSRAELLAELTALRRTLAVAGSHGKTTTASMLVHALEGAGMHPGWLVGATIGDGLPNARWGTGEWLVVEADESDRSMLELNVELVLLTSVELDHTDAFGSLQELRGAFRALLARAPRAVIWDRPELLALREGPLVAYDARELSLAAGSATFAWRGRQVRLRVPGAHNAINAAGALEAARAAGASEREAVAALADFHGAGRRFQRLGVSSAGAVLYDDYAHHPSEVAATLRAARLQVPAGGRLLAVFQPHLYSRTSALAPEFGRALSLADVAVVLDVYPARERAEAHPGVSGLMIAENVTQASAGRPVYWLPTFAAAERVLRQMLRQDDVCVLMGAGNVDELGSRLLEAAAARAPRAAAGASS